MKELNLFTGAGGGLLGSLLLGWELVGYVEFNEYCQRVLAARIRDGYIPNAPIYGDIRAFNSEGYAAAHQGLVDVVSGGFPCQPFSTAGKQLGSDDPRNMWPATIETVRLVRPRYCFFENVPGLLNSGYFGTIVKDLAESGYCVRWRILSAAEAGAPHLRNRLWIVAHHWRERVQGSIEEKVQGKPLLSWHKNGGGIEIKRIGPNVYSPQLCRSRNEVADYVDRVRPIGNGQVPSVAATAWRLLTEDLEIE